MINPIFRQITPVEAESAYSIICETVKWMHTRGIRQWTESLPKAVYEKRLRDGENFGLFVDSTVVVVLSLIQEAPAHWAEETGGTRLDWLCTLATGNAFRGRKLGEFAVRKAIETNRNAGINALYLDCARENGFLPNYYQSLGFQTICSKIIHWPKCGPQEMVLMMCDLMRA